MCPAFTGREATLDEMAVRPSGGQRQPALTSMGGAGKSQLAIEYVYRHQSEYDLVWWVPSESTASIRLSLEPLWCADHFPAELQDVARSAGLRAVVTHRPGGPLTATAIRQCCGLA